MTLKIFDSYGYFPTGVDLTTLATADGWFGEGLGRLRAFNDLPPFISNPGHQMGWSNGFVTTSTVFRYVGSRVVHTTYIGQRMYFPKPAAPYRIGVWDSQCVDTELQFYLEFDSIGTIRVYRATSNAGDGVLIGLSQAGRYFEDNWFWLEMKFDIGASVNIDVRVNTVTVISLLNVNNHRGTPFGGQPNGFDAMYYATVGTVGTRSDTRWADFYCLDDQGSVNNGYLGNVRCQTQLVVANATPIDFTIGGSAPAATNWQSVQNTSLDDTKYVYSPTDGDQDLYNIQSIINSPVVHGVIAKGFYRQDDATQRSVKNTIQTGTGVNAAGSEKFVNVTYTGYFDVFELNPDTGVGWTGLEVNALKIGPKVIS